jgi:rubrerythrin
LQTPSQVDFPLRTWLTEAAYGADRKGVSLFSLNEILDMAIRIEKNGEAAYRVAIKKISDPALVSALEWMADEEAKHVRWFMELKHDVETTAGNPFVQEMDGDFFRDFMSDQSFSLREVDFSKVDRVDELIDIFIEFEEDSILFYDLLQPFVQDQDTLAQLERIKEEEKRHIEQLREFIERKTPLTEGGNYQ